MPKRAKKNSPRKPTRIITIQEAQKPETDPHVHQSGVVLHVPIEILGMICRHYTSVQFPLALSKGISIGKLLPPGKLPIEVPPDVTVYDDTIERMAQVLSVLSKTCRSLRSNALPLLYQTISVILTRRAFIGTYSPDRFTAKSLATELVEKMEIVTIRHPFLANYVKAFHVVLTSFSALAVFKELARVLQILPNLETLEILACPEQNRLKLTGAFSKVQLPTVRKLSLCTSADGILHVFPNVTEFNLSLEGEVEGGRNILKLLRQMPQLRILDGVNLTHLDWRWTRRSEGLPFFANAFPRLELLYLTCEGVANHTMEHIPTLPLSLRKLVLHLGFFPFWGEPNYSEVLEAFKQRMSFGTRQDPCYFVVKWNTTRNADAGRRDAPHWQITLGSEGKWVQKEVKCEESRLFHGDRCCR
ncbi:hypothetical protein DL96DRAFT_1684753 [Flagelloscypha sp. PMI_526]|nr:hypothetical protein DL96DRAFT_1684753 [Flagelloscypha sp. PMI_526]